jgi:TonB family protein
MNTDAKQFSQHVLLVAGVHAALIVALIFFEGFKIKRPVPITVDLMSLGELLGELPQGEGKGLGTAPKNLMASAQPPVATEPTLAPAPPPISKPSVGKEDVLIPQKTQKTAQTSQKKPTVSTNVVSKTAPRTTSTAKSSPRTGTSSTTSAPSAEQIRAQLARAMGTGSGGADSGTGGAVGYGRDASFGGGSGEGRLGKPTGTPWGTLDGVGPGSPFASYYKHVHDEMYEAWEQPKQLTGQGLMATVVLRVARNGQILNAEMRVPSGNRDLDESALAAVRRVQKLRPLPDGLGDAHADIVVNFKLSDA